METSDIEFNQADIQAVARYHYETSLYAFVKAAWHVLEPSTDLIDGWHIRVLCEHLEAVSRGEITRLAISIPPGFMKSLIVSVFWPAWEWTHSPHLRFLTTSSSEAFCERDAGKMRMLIGSEWYHALWPMTFGVDTILRFVNDKLGERIGKSFQSLTGGRANRLILDDVISVELANSEFERQKVSRRYFEQATSRLSREDGAIVIIMQRVHEDDLIGELKARQDRGDDLGFEFLTIPMEYEGDGNETSIGYRDPRTKSGELILPGYRSAKWVAREKVSMGAYAWNAQYQQEPTPRGNGFFNKDDFKLYKPDQLPTSLNYYLTSDHANGGKDYNVFRVWGLDSEKNYWLVDSFRERCTIQKALGLKIEAGKFKVAAEGAFALIAKYKPICWYADQDEIIKSNRQLINEAMLATNLFIRFEIVPHGGRDKMARASSFQVLSSLGKIKIPDNFIGQNALAEYQAFGPSCRHDDQVDADGLLPRMAAHAAIATPADTKSARDEYRADGGCSGASDTSFCF